MTSRTIDITRETSGNIAILVLNGSLDSSNLAELKMKMDDCIAEGVNILLNCSQLEYASSQVFGLFSYYNKECKQKDIVFSLCAINDKIFNVFKLLGLSNVFLTFKTQEEAIKHIE